MHVGTTMRDAGADAIFDFVDAGLPSTLVEPAAYEAALLGLLAQLGGAQPDVVVAEAGASPLEPYNGDVALEDPRPPRPLHRALRLRSVRGPRRHWRSPI